MEVPLWITKRFDELGRDPSTCARADRGRRSAWTWIGVSLRPRRSVTIPPLTRRDRRLEGEHVVPGARGGPDLVVLQQVGIDEDPQRFV